MVNTTLSSFDAATFESIETQLSAIDVTKEGSMLNQANTMLKAGVTVTATLGNLLDSNISTALSKMTSETLQSAYDANGLAGQVDAILEGAAILFKAATPAVDAINAFQSANSTGVANITLPDLNQYKQTYVSALKPLQVVTDADGVIEEKGPILYLIGVAEAMAKAQQLQSGGGGSGGNSSGSGSSGGGTTLGYNITLADDLGSVFKDENMKVRSASAGPGETVVCVTRSCLEKTINAAFDGSDLVPFMATGALPVPQGVGITLLLLLPWVLPVLVVFCGLCAVVGKSGLNGCGMCALLFTFLFLPWIFFFAGTIFFPTMIAFTDACVSAEAVGKVQLEQYSYFCPAGNYVADTGICTVSVAVPSSTSTVTLDVDARSELFGGTAAGGGGGGGGGGGRHRDAEHDRPKSLLLSLVSPLLRCLRRIFRRAVRVCRRRCPVEDCGEASLRRAREATRNCDEPGRERRGFGKPRSQDRDHGGEVQPWIQCRDLLPERGRSLVVP